MLSLRSLKILGACLCLIIFASNVRVMSHWNEARGVYDDICYLQQAHLFQLHGLKGIDTDFTSDDDHWVSNKLKEINFPTWQNPLSAPCHTQIEATHKLVLQYPPGTGFVLAAFPAGFQVVPMYVSAMSIVLLCALGAIACAHTPYRLTAAWLLGSAAIYFMINPAKASYSIAPTMVVCAVAGWLTALLFQARAPERRLWLTPLLGFVLGLSVNFRIANLFLLAGYCLYFLIAFVVVRRREPFLQGVLFGAACLVGMAPTLVANTVNAGRPWSTTYGPGDAVPIDWTFSIVPQYFREPQGPLLVYTALCTIGMVFADWGRQSRRLSVVIAINLAVGGFYFMTHPIFTQYYIIPLVMLSLWSLLFAYVMQDRPVPAARLSR